MRAFSWWCWGVKSVTQQEQGAMCDQVCADQTQEKAEGACDKTACQDKGGHGGGRRDPGTGDQSPCCRSAWCQDTVGRTGRGRGKDSHVAMTRPVCWNICLLAWCVPGLSPGRLRDSQSSSCFKGGSALNAGTERTSEPPPCCPGTPRCVGRGTAQECGRGQGRARTGG